MSQCSGIQDSHFGHLMLPPFIIHPSRRNHLHTLIPVSNYNSNNSYPSNSARDRLRFLVFTSWWTVVFTAVYLACFLTGALSFLTSIASHAAWLFLT